MCRKMFFFYVLNPVSWIYFESAAAQFPAVFTQIAAAAAAAAAHRFVPLSPAWGSVLKTEQR